MESVFCLSYPLNRYSILDLIYWLVNHSIFLTPDSITASSVLPHPKSMQICDGRIFNNVSIIHLARKRTGWEKKNLGYLRWKVEQLLRNLINMVFPLSSLLKGFTFAKELNAYFILRRSSGVFRMVRFVNATRNYAWP